MIRFDRATIDDDAELRAVLRDNGMQGWVTMTMEREPSYFSGLGRFGEDEAVIARQAGDTVGMYQCSTHPLFVNGRAERVGYLGGLRVNPAYRNRLRIVRSGFASVRSIGAASGRPFWYTSVASDNDAARRLLEANLAGMPTYAPCGTMVSMAMPRARGRRLGLWEPVAADDLRRFCDRFNRTSARFQFSPSLDPESAARTGARFFLATQDGEAYATMALWNQQGYKQVVARRYRWPLSLAIPLYNAYARATRRICLPPVGHALDQTYMAFFGVAPGYGDRTLDLLRDAISHCTTQVLTFGLHAAHEQLAEIQKAFRPTNYRTGIYVVHFDNAPAIDARPTQPEIAIL